MRKTKSQLERELKAVKKELAKFKSRTAVDILADALTAAQIPFERDCWGVEPGEWLDIRLFSKGKNSRYTIHFYFSPKLSEVEIWKCKRVYDEANEVKLSA